MPTVTISPEGKEILTAELRDNPHMKHVVVDQPVRFTVDPRDYPPSVMLRLDLPDNETIVTVKVPSRELLILYHTLREQHKDVDFGG